MVWQVTLQLSLLSQVPVELLMFSSLGLVHVIVSLHASLVPGRTLGRKEKGIALKKKTLNPKP